MEFDYHIVSDEDRFESDSDKQSSSDTVASGQQTSTEELSDRLVLEAVNKLLKVNTSISFLLVLQCFIVDSDYEYG